MKHQKVTIIYSLHEKSALQTEAIRLESHAFSHFLNLTNWQFYWRYSKGVAI